MRRFVGLALVSLVLFPAIPRPAAASPLLDLEKRFELRPGALPACGPVEVTLPLGALTFRQGILAFGPSPFPLLVELRYSSQSLLGRSLSRGWHLGGDPWSGAVPGWEVLFDGRRRIVGRKADGGAGITYRFDREDRFVGLESTAGFSWNTDFDKAGRIAGIQSGAVVQATLAYGADGNLATLRFPDGREWNFQYDRAGRLAEVLGPEGYALKAAYDARNRVKTLGGNCAAQFSYQETSEGLTVAVGSGNGPDRTYRYAADRSRATVSTAAGVELSFVYDAAGRLQELRDGLGRKERYRYDANGQLVEFIDPAGGRTSFDYVKGKPTRMTAPGGAATRYRYDAAGRLEGEVSDLFGESRRSYDEQGHLVAVSGARGTSRFSYSPEGHRIGESRPLGLDLLFEYDRQGRWVGATNGVEHIRFSLSEQGLLENVKTDRLSQRSYAYDLLGRVTETAAPGERLRYRWSQNTRLEEVTDVLGATTHYEHDSRGRLFEIRSGSEVLASFRRDDLGQILERDDRVSRRTTTYDAGGRVARTVNGRGQEVVFTPDALDRIGAVRGPDGAGGKLAYDKAGRLERLESDGFAQEFRYDKQGRPAEVRDARLKDAVRLEYDAAGRRSAVALPGGKRIRYGYDELGRLASLGDPLGGEFRFSYGKDFLRSKAVYPNGVTIFYLRDATGRLVGLQLQGKDGKPLAKTTYEYDASGRLNAERGPGGWQVTADAAGRIAAEEREGGKVLRCEYDGRWNLTRVGEETFTYDTADRLVRARGETFTYDDDGNLAKRAGGASVAYAWDSLGRLTETTAPSGVVRYGYDLAGRRHTRDAAGRRTLFFLDQDDDLLEFDPGGKVGRIYVAGDGLDELFAVVDGSDILYVVQDLFRNVRWLFDAAGRPVGELRYGPWGDLQGDAKLLERVGRGYRGRPFDPDTGLYDFRARWYDPGLRRFLSVDPDRGDPAVPISSHPYLFCRNNPLVFDDPRGTYEQRREPYVSAVDKIVAFPGQVLRGIGGMLYDAGSAVYDGLVNVGCGVRNFERDPGKFVEDKARDAGNAVIDAGTNALTTGGASLQRGAGVLSGSPVRAYEASGRKLDQIQGERSPEEVDKLGQDIRSVANPFTSKTQLVTDLTLAGSIPNDKVRMQEISRVISDAEKQFGDGLKGLGRDAVKATASEPINDTVKEWLNGWAGYGDSYDANFFKSAGIDSVAEKVAGGVTDLGGAAIVDVSDRVKRGSQPPRPDTPPATRGEDSPFDKNYDDFVKTNDQKEQDRSVKQDRSVEQDTWVRDPKDDGYTSKDLSETLEKNIKRIITLSTECDSERSCGEGLECRNGKCEKSTATTTTTTTECTTDTDCATGKTCVDGKCTKKTTTTTATTTATECTTDADCATGKTCVSGKCTKTTTTTTTAAECTTDAECPTGKTCVSGKCTNKKTTTTTTAECTKDTDCPTGKTCLNGKCEKKKKTTTTSSGGGSGTSTSTAVPSGTYEPKGSGQSCQQMREAIVARCSQIEKDCARQNCAKNSYSGCAEGGPGCGGTFPDYVSWCTLHPSYEPMASAGLTAFVNEIKVCIDLYLSDDKSGRGARGYECQGKSQKKLADKKTTWVQQACQARCAQDGRSGVAVLGGGRHRCECR